VTVRIIAALFLVAAFVGARTPAAQTPAAQTPAAQTPAAQTPAAQTPAQTDVGDAALERASERRTIDIGLLSTGGGVATIPLEVYVARVLAGEAEPGAADAAQQALAVAIRTYAIVNEGRHRRDGFDLCDTTHCQVMHRE